MLENTMYTIKVNSYHKENKKFEIAPNKIILLNLICMWYRYILDFKEMFGNLFLFLRRAALFTSLYF